MSALVAAIYKFTKTKLIDTPTQCNWGLAATRIARNLGESFDMLVGVNNVGCVIGCRPEYDCLSLLSKLRYSCKNPNYFISYLERQSYHIPL